MSKAKHLSFKLSKVKASGVAIAMAIIIIGVVGAMAALFLVALTEPAEAVKCGSRGTLIFSSTGAANKNFPSGAKKLEVLDIAVLANGSYMPTKKDAFLVTVSSANINLNGYKVYLRDKKNILSSGTIQKNKVLLGGFSLSGFDENNNKASLNLMVDFTGKTLPDSSWFRFNITKFYPAGGFLKCPPRVSGLPIIGSKIYQAIKIE